MRRRRVEDQVAALLQQRSDSTSPASTNDAVDAEQVVPLSAAGVVRGEELRTRIEPSRQAWPRRAPGRWRATASASRARVRQAGVDGGGGWRRRATGVAVAGFLLVETAVGPAAAGPARRAAGATGKHVRIITSRNRAPSQRVTNGYELMPNTVKTAVLLGVMSALLLFLGEALGGAQGLVIGFRLRRRHQLRLVLVLGQDRAGDVPGAASRSRVIASIDVVARLAAARRSADAARLCHPGGVAECFRDRPQPAARGRGGDRGHPADLIDDELDGVIAHELAHVKHRDILISSIAATLAAAIMMVSRFAMFFGGGRSDDRRGRSNPIALLATMHPRAAGRGADSGGHFAVTRIRRRRGRCSHRRQSSRPGERAAEDRECGARRPARCQSGDRAHVHHQAVLAWAACCSLFSTHPPTEQRIRRAARAALSESA